MRYWFVGLGSILGRDKRFFFSIKVLYENILALSHLDML
jgi:hypothetical protein